MPFLDRHNDHLQLYVKRHNGDVLFTDDGYTITDLEQSGCSLTSPKWRELLSLTLNGFGVKLDNDALVVKTTAGDSARKMHDLVQAMLAVDDLFCLAEPVVTSLFYEDVSRWLTDVGARFAEDVKFTGKSGLDYRFDFVIPRSQAQPERVLRAPASARATTSSGRLLRRGWGEAKDFWERTVVIASKDENLSQGGVRPRHGSTPALRLSYANSRRHRMHRGRPALL